jgi:hypothetical protein
MTQYAPQPNDGGQFAVGTTWRCQHSCLCISKKESNKANSVNRNRYSWWPLSTRNSFRRRENARDDEHEPQIHIELESSALAADDTNSGTSSLLVNSIVRRWSASRRSCTRHMEGRQ